MEPIYRSLMDSFQLNFSRPDTGLVSPPALACPADERLAGWMADSTPQAVLMEVQPGLEQSLHLIRGRTYPILRWEDAEAGALCIRLCEENHLGDVTLCVPWRQRELLAEVRRALPLSRGMLDLRGVSLPEDILELSGACQLNEATQLLLDRPLSRAQNRALQKRFIQVWVQAETSIELANAVCSGALGILTSHPEELLRLLSRFPENSTARPIPLYAHKGFHNSGEFPENSISGVLAAAERGYDAAEIDIQPSRDGVLLLQHDTDTHNLFDRNARLYETDYESLHTLRRKSFPQHGLDRLDQLMPAMSRHQETPVLIEIKPPRDSFGVETCVRQMREILSRPDAQKHCTAIMGQMPPYLDYVHRRLPTLPLAHCVMGLGERPPENDAEGNRQIYQLALDTRGANAGVNPYHRAVNDRFARLAHLRGITVFVWTWAFKPWEEEQAAICQDVRSCYDGLTSDWVDRFAELPVDLILEMPNVLPAGQTIHPCAQVLLRTGVRIPAENLEVIPLSGNVYPENSGALRGEAGEALLLFCCRSPLPDGSILRLCGQPLQVRFE